MIAVPHIRWRSRLLSNVPHTLRLWVHGRRRLGEGRAPGLAPRRVMRRRHLLDNGLPHGGTHLTWRRRDAPRRRRKDGFMHSASRSAHRVLPRGIAIVCRSRVLARHAVVLVVDVATVSVAIIPILETFHRRGGVRIRGGRRSTRGTVTAGPIRTATPALLMLAGVRWELLLHPLKIHAVLLHRLHLRLQARDR